MEIRKYILPLFAMFVVLGVNAQEENPYVREGNRLYKSGKYTDAEVAYRKGLQKNSKSVEAAYNLGNALFKQEKYAEALEQFQRVAPTEKLSKEKLSAALHNTGNALLMEQKVKESIEAYKKSLKVNPKDDDTRYNLAYAQQLLKQQENQDNNKGQDKQEQQDQQDADDKKQQDNKNQEQEDNPQQSDLSKEKADQILQALMQDEQDTMEKAKKQPVGSRKGIEKDW